MSEDKPKEEPKIEPVTTDERINQLEEALKVMAVNQNTIIKSLSEPTIHQPVQQPQEEKQNAILNMIAPFVQKELMGDKSSELDNFFAEIGKQDFAIFRRALAKRYLRGLTKDEVKI